MNVCTAVGAIDSKKNYTITFKSEAHKIFYLKYLPECRYQDVYHKALVYCLGIDADTRNHVNSIYDFKTGCVKTKCLNEGWQNSGSIKIVRMAFNLYKNCSFCSIAAYFDMFEGCRMRYRSVKSVFEEIKYLYQNYNIRKFCFWDDNFIIPGKRGIERCRELVELIKSLPEKISLELETRVDTISYEAISLLKEGGLRHIHIGIESMIDRDLKLYNKGVTIKQNKEALNILNELGYSTKVGSKYRIATYLICFNPLTRLEDVETLLDFFKAYDISPKKQISALQITNNTLIKEILKREGVTINKNNEWKFLDNRVEDIFIKYSNFVKDAMEKRDELRTVEKIKVFNENSKILQQISSVRECIDKQCTCCLETLVKLHLDNKGKDYIEFEYQKSVQRFNRFLDEVMNMNVWKYIDKYNNIFMQENL